MICSKCGGSEFLSPTRLRNNMFSECTECGYLEKYHNNYPIRTRFNEIPNPYPKKNRPYRKGNPNE